MVGRRSPRASLSHPTLVARVLLTLLALTLSSSRLSFAQAFRGAGAEFNAMRPVTVPLGKACSVIVTQFFHHGEIAADGRNLLVCTKNQKPVPARVLQLGPGDYCRLCFEVVPGQSGYEIYYGGEAPAADAVPAWNNSDGLLLETREFKQCNLHRFDSVRDAFNSSKPIGADYVPAVQHSHNPFALGFAPFLSRYTGTLHIDKPGTYGFMTSSQDCSFLLVNGKVVVEAPGAHHPQHHALRGSRKDIQLSAGPHRFEYYHAASGPSAMMVAAWEVNPRDPKPQPQAIPGEVFRTGAIGTAVAGTLTMRKEKVVPDFVAAILHSVPLPDNDVPLIGVQFRSISPRAISSNLSWNFGDGQSSEVENPAHVYLRPGLYTVKLAYRRGGNPLETTNRIYVDQPKITDNEKRPKLEEYLTVLRGYDPRTLDAVSLRQWILAFQAKAEALQATAEEETPSPRETEEDPKRAARKRERALAQKTESLRYIASAVAAGRAALTEPSAAAGDQDLLKLARLAGPMARDQLGDSKLAGSIWAGAGRKISAVEPKAECQIEAADIAVNDMASAPLAKTFLDAADQSLRGSKFGALAAQGAPRARRLLRARGRWQIRASPTSKPRLRTARDGTTPS